MPLLTSLVAGCAAGTPPLPSADRLYVLDCGQNVAADQSRWSPGVNVGLPIVLSDNCYLIRHRTGYLLWDTGYPDAVAEKPVTGPIGTATRAKTLAAQFAEIGITPADIAFVGISHTHGDHVGNVAMFAKSRILIQSAEYDWAFGAGRTPPFAPSIAVEKLDGDRDVFGDGSVVIFTTPGHTPGHQSLLLRLPNTGAIVLTGDAVHFRSNWEYRRVPVQNVDRDKTLASMARIEETLARAKAQIWINHDKPQSDSQRRSPEYYD